MLERNLAKLPPKAWIDNRSGERVPGVDAPVIGLTRGEPGYAPIYTEITADELNTAQGVTPAQREAMFAGSMFGFHVPGADPDQYDETGRFKKASA